MVCGEMANAAPCDDGWLAMGWRVSRGELAGRWLAGSRRMLRRGQRMARSEMADAVQGVARCCAERRQMACGGGRQMLRRVLQMVCGASADGAQRVEECCAGSKRMVRGGSASFQQKALRDYIWHARVIAHFGKRAIHQVKRVCFP